MLNQDELKQLMEAANKAEADGKLGGGEFKELPDGEYYGTIEKAVRGMTKAGKDKVEIVLEITDGEYARRLHWVNFVLEHDNPMVSIISLKNLDKLAKEFKIIPPDDNIANFPLEDVLEAFTGQEVRFKIKQKGEYKNTYINAC